MDKEDTRHALREVAWVFLKLGVTAFGGPAAHIALMEEEVVRRRQWVTREHFLDMVSAAQLIPGPNSTELAIHLGRVRAGWAGLLVAGVCFIIPAMALVMGLAWAYVETGSLPAAKHVLQGLQPVIVAVILQALWGLGKTAVKGWKAGAIAVASVVACSFKLPELGVLLAAGAVSALLIKRDVNGKSTTSAMFLPAVPMVSAGMGSISLPGIFGVFLKIGSVLYGSGYVLLAFLRADLVERLGWLTESQLLDAVAVGQVTPGPVFTTATFIGYLLSGPQGAVVATVGIFLPAFFFVAISGPLIPRIRQSRVAGAFLDGVNAASLALLVVVSWELGVHSITNLAAVLMCMVSLVVLIRFKLNSTWLLAAGALLGWLGMV